MKLLRKAAGVLALAVAGQSAYADWFAAADTMVDGQAQVIVEPAGDPHFDAWASAQYCRAQTLVVGQPYACELTDFFSAFASVTGSQWTKKYVWGCGGWLPPSWSAMDVMVRIEWDVLGNADNHLFFTHGMAHSGTHAQVTIDTEPDSGGDHVAIAHVDGKKREGDAFWGVLKLDWEADRPGGEVSLTWDTFAPSEGYHSYGGYTNRYIQSVWNWFDGGPVGLISATVRLQNESWADADTNAEVAFARGKCEIEEFELSQPVMD